MNQSARRLTTTNTNKPPFTLQQTMTRLRRYSKPPLPVHLSLYRLQGQRKSKPRSRRSRHNLPASNATCGILLVSIHRQHQSQCLPIPPTCLHGVAQPSLRHDQSLSHKLRHRTSHRRHFLKPMYHLPRHCNRQMTSSPTCILRPGHRAMSKLEHTMSDHCLHRR